MVLKYLSLTPVILAPLLFLTNYETKDQDERPCGIGDADEAVAGRGSEGGDHRHFPEAELLDEDAGWEPS